MKKVLLFSGGMDSWLIRHFWKPDISLYIDIHGKYSEFEKRRLPKDVEVVPLPLGRFEQENFIVPLRNLYFFMIASNFGDRLCLGATRGDNHRDKTATFYDLTEQILTYLWGPQSKQPEGRIITIEREYLSLSKIDLVERFRATGGDLRQLELETFSCYTPQDGKECLACKPCFRKFVALAYNGYLYPREDRFKMWQFVRKEIVPRARNTELQTYYSDRAGEGAAAVEVVKRLYKEFGGDITADENS